MKQLASIILLFLMTFTSAWAQPKATFDKTTIDLGGVLWKNPATINYQVKNTGNKPLVLSNVTTSCGCTEVVWTQNSIEPGESGVIVTTFDAQSLGRFQKSVGVYCNADVKPIYLMLKGEVTTDITKVTSLLPYQIGHVRLNKNHLEFDEVSRGEQQTIEIMVANVSEEPYLPILMHLPPYLTAEAFPEELAPNSMGKIVVTLHSDKLPKLGLTRSSVYLSRFLGDIVGEENELPLSAILLPDLSHLSEAEQQFPPVLTLSANELHFSDMTGNKKKHQTIKITNTGNSDLKIKDLQVFNSALGVRLNKRILQPGTSAKMKITLYGSQLKKIKNAPRVLMITNDPKQTKLIIPIKVTTKE
ncbi:MAG: DUF1573 domain-containing protein [Phocaeicola sp.]